MEEGEDMIIEVKLYYVQCNCCERYLGGADIGNAPILSFKIKQKARDFAIETGWRFIDGKDSFAECFNCRKDV